MAASGFWIGVESMTAEALAVAVAHPRPVFCGRSSGDDLPRAALAETGAKAEWHHGIALDTAIGQGYLLDLMRQRGPVERIVLALPLVSTSEGGRTDALMTPLDTVLAETREIIEGLIVVIRGAEAVMEPGVGAGMTVLCPKMHEPKTSLARGVLAFVGEFVASESERWSDLGLSLALVSGGSIDQ